MTSRLHFGSFLQPEYSNLLTKLLKEKKVLILVDENTHKHCLPHLFATVDGLSGAEIVELPSGELHKTLDFCLPVWETLTECNFSRKDVLVVLGGGVLCDMGGLIAGMYKRGMTCILIPTTLLSMVDASVGGKTGVDFGAFKNHLGIFREPEDIFFDNHFLHTLSPKEYSNGLAEMLKHALIEGNVALFLELIGSFGNRVLGIEYIKYSVESKLKIVTQDPHEQGLRKVLNLGHTVAHAIEGYCLDKNPMDHGLAVAHGLVVEACISKILGQLTVEEFDFIKFEICSIFSFQKFTESEINAMIALMKNDKKNTAEEPEFVLMESLEKINHSVKVPNDIIFEGMKEILL